MQLHIFTLFPRVCEGYLAESMMKRAQARAILSVHVHDIRAYSHDAHRRVDGRPYGGGPGMVLQADSLVRAVETVFTQEELHQKQKKQKTKIILTCAGGAPFTQKKAAAWAKKYQHIFLIAGHYEGVDARVGKIIKDISGIAVEDVSIGPYTLTGGELASLVMIDAVARHLPGFLGKEESLEEKRQGIGVPVYTRPEVLEWRGKTYRVPKILRLGNHAKIDAWRRAHTKRN